MGYANTSSKAVAEETSPAAEPKSQPAVIDPTGMAAIAQSKELLELLGLNPPKDDEKEEKKERDGREKPEPKGDIDETHDALDAESGGVPWKNIGKFVTETPDSDLDAAVPAVLEGTSEVNPVQAKGGSKEAISSIGHAAVRGAVQGALSTQPVQKVTPKWMSAAGRRQHFPTRTRRLVEFLINERVCIVYSRQQLMTMPHQKLVRLVDRHLRGNPQRFPPWVRYMIINYTGLRYRCAHGTYKPTAQERTAWRRKYRWYVTFQAWRYRTEKDLAPFFIRAVCDQIGSIAQRARGVMDMVRQGAIGLRGKANWYKRMKRRGRGSWHRIRSQRQDPTNQDFRPGTTLLFTKWMRGPANAATMAPTKLRAWLESSYGGECILRGRDPVRRASDGRYKMWGHESTVVYVNASAGKVACFETASRRHGAGMRYYTISALRRNPNVYVGYVPGGSGGTSPATTARLAELRTYLGGTPAIQLLLRKHPRP